MKSRTYFLLLFTLILAACSEERAVEEANDKPSLEADTTEINLPGLKIAFIYGDTINKNYSFLIDAEEELQKEQKVIEDRINRKLRKAEKRAMELQQQAATMTQIQVQEAQLELQNLDIEIQQFQEKLASEFRKREIELQQEYTERINEMLEEYNSDDTYDMILNFQQGGNLLWINDAYDITSEVLQKLNEEYERDINADMEEPKKN